MLSHPLLTEPGVNFVNIRFGRDFDEETVDEESAGEYICVAESSAGVLNASFTLTVLGMTMYYTSTMSTRDVARITDTSFTSAAPDTSSEGSSVIMRFSFFTFERLLIIFDENFRQFVTPYITIHILLVQDVVRE